MSLQYEKDVQNIVRILNLAHNPDVAKIRTKFFAQEDLFFCREIQGTRVLVAGSGLGYEAMELARFNTEVIGVEILSPLVVLANKEKEKREILNPSFEQGDIIKLRFPDKYFGAAVLNMGTIGNFDDKLSVVRELLRVAHKVILDFYTTNQKHFEERTRMYEEEGWKNVHVEGITFVSDDGLESKSIEESEFEDIAKKLNIHVRFHPFYSFAKMAVFQKL